jgi:aryl-alcohol dehydrogenase-like predicted oxidoreductase
MAHPKRRQLGRSGIEVAPFGFGGNVFGWTADERTSFELLDRFTDAGFNLIDTADMYSIWAPGHVGGESEELIGRWLRRSGKRESVVIATKVGLDMGPGGKGLGRSHIEKSVELSLKRLGTDHVDLYQAHTDDESTPLVETLEAFTGLIKAGKVRAIGASNYSATRLAEALAISKARGISRFETLQPRYNLADRLAFEGQLQPLCLREEIGVIPYYALAAGFLTGKYRSKADLAKSPRGQGAAGRYFDSAAPLIATLDKVADRHKVGCTQVAMAWLASRPSVAAPLASATSLQQLEEIIAGVTLKLDQESLGDLEKASKGL